MAGLMTDVYTYEALVNKYAGFSVPAVRLYVDGRELDQDMTRNILKVEISLSVSAAGMAVIRIGNIYKREERAFDQKIRGRLKLGAIVEVGIGYGSEITKVLKGFVALLGAEFTETPCLVVTVMDVRRLMMLGGVHQVLHHVKNYSDAVKTILDGYSRLCKAEIDPTNDNLEAPLSQNATDYDFIAGELAGSGRAGREFFVLGDTAYFRKPAKETRPVMQMEFGRELQMFRMEAGYLDLEVQVSGYDAREQKIIRAGAAAKSGEPQASLSSRTPVSCILDPEADTQDKAGTRAEALAREQTAGVQRAQGTCIGLPGIVPGRYVEIVKLEAMADRKYYVTSVRHEISEEFFVTEFETEGWA